MEPWGNVYEWNIGKIAHIQNPARCYCEEEDCQHLPNVLHMTAQLLFQCFNKALHKFFPPLKFTEKSSFGRQSHPSCRGKLAGSSSRLMFSPLPGDQRNYSRQLQQQQAAVADHSGGVWSPLEVLREDSIAVNTVCCILGTWTCSLSSSRC